MYERKSFADILFIVIYSIVGVLLLVAIILPLTQGFNPIKLAVGDVDEYNFIEEPEYRNTNILEGLLKVEDPNLYNLDMPKKQSYSYIDADESKPYHKTNINYSIKVEAYNQPFQSINGIEVYGPFGLEIDFEKIELSNDHQKLIDALTNSYPESNFVPYYSAEIDGNLYVSVVDLTSSSISLEKFTGTEFEPVVNVSNNVWRKIQEENGGTVVLRDPNGSLFFDSGKYRLNISMKQLVINKQENKIDFKVMSPCISIYNFIVNEHSCSKGILIANDSLNNLDIQLNVVNNDSVVSYSSNSRVNVGENLKLGVSFSKSRYDKMNGLFSALGASVVLEVYRYDNLEEKYILVENEEIATGFSTFANKQFTFDSSELITGRYKILMKYNSWFETIEQEYEYYFVFED